MNQGGVEWIFGPALGAGLIVRYGMHREERGRGRIPGWTHPYFLFGPSRGIVFRGPSGVPGLPGINTPPVSYSRASKHNNLDNTGLTQRASICPVV